MIRICCIGVLFTLTSFCRAQEKSSLSAGGFVASSPVFHRLTTFGVQLQQNVPISRRSDVVFGAGVAIPIWQDASFTYVYNPRQLPSGGFDTASCNVDQAVQRNLLFARVGGRVRLGKGRSDNGRSWFVAGSFEGARWHADFRGTVRYFNGGERSYRQQAMIYQSAVRVGLEKDFSVFKRGLHVSLTIRTLTWNYGWYASGRLGHWFEMPLLGLAYTIL